MHKKNIVPILILILVVFVFFVFIKNNKIAMNWKATDAISGLTSNKGTGNTPSGEVNKSLSDSQNGFTIKIEKVEITKERTIVYFKATNKNNVAVDFYPTSSIVQGTKQYTSIDLLFTTATMPNVENEGKLFFQSLGNRDKIILYFTAKPHSSSLPNAQWHDIKFEINLSGDILVDKAAEEAKVVAKAEEAAKAVRDEYMNTYHKYAETIWDDGAPGQTVEDVVGKVDGHQLYAKVTEFKEGESLKLEIVYFDDNKEKHIVKTFSTTKVATNNREVGDMAMTKVPYYRYLGQFHYPDSQKNAEVYNSSKNSSGSFDIGQDVHGYEISDGWYYYPPELGSPHVTSVINSYRLGISSAPYLP